MQKKPRNNVLHFAILILIYYGLLYCHSWILYSAKIGQVTIALQALYRCIVAVLPLFISLWLIRSSHGIGKVFICVLWLFIIPYPFYNFFQLRHIAEIFTYRNTFYLTQSNSINEIWKMLPTAMYAFSQLILFYYCLYNVTLKWEKWKRLFVIISVNLYVALCTAFGLSVRLDTYHLITDFDIVFRGFIVLIYDKSFRINIAFIFAFSVLVYFILLFVYSYHKLQDNNQHSYKEKPQS